MRSTSLLPRQVGHLLRTGGDSVQQLLDDVLSSIKITSAASGQQVRLYADRRDGSTGSNASRGQEEASTSYGSSQQTQRGSASRSRGDQRRYGGRDQPNDQPERSTGRKRDDGLATGERSQRPALFAGSAPTNTPARGSKPQGAVFAAQTDLALRNAPKQVFELIGDPRTGVADDVTKNPFGEISVDMVWHQLSNEVYWYKYDYTGGAMTEAHRDGRLSDYTRNLIYILRASNPHKWSIDVLAQKFRIRKQRVLAILALKEIEAQRMESGRSLAGPMAAYRMPVWLEDVQLIDPDTGVSMPLDLGSPGAATSGQDTASGSSTSASNDQGTASMPSQGSAYFTTQRTVQRTAHTARTASLQLLELLAPYDYDISAMQGALDSELEELKALVARLQAGVTPPGGEASTSVEVQASDSSESTPGSSSSTGAKAEAGSSAESRSGSFGSESQGVILELSSYEGAIRRVLSALEPFLTSPGPLSQQRDAARAARAASQLTAVLHKAGVLDKVAQLPLGTTSEGELSEVLGDAAVVSEAKHAVGQRLDEMDDELLEQSLYCMGLMERGVVLRMLPQVASRLNARGVDMQHAVRETSYRGPQRAASSSSSSRYDSTPALSDTEGADASVARRRQQRQQQQLQDAEAHHALLLDVFGFVEHAESVHSTLLDALAALEKEHKQLVRALRTLVLAQQHQQQKAGDETQTTRSSGAALGNASSAKIDDGLPASLQLPLLPLGSKDLRKLRGRVSEYSGAEVLVAEAYRQLPERPASTPNDRSTLLRLLQEMEPDAVARILAYEAYLLRTKAVKMGTKGATPLTEEERAALFEKLLAPAGRVMAVGADVSGRAAALARASVAGGEEQAGAEAGTSTPAGRWSALERTNWDWLSAWVESKVQGRVYARGSGERHFVRLPTYPAFEGYPLSDFDAAAESEVSAANRHVAQQQEEEMYQRFEEDMHYNLGVTGETLHDHSTPPLPPNLRSALGTPMVVYDVSADGTTRLPPLHVALPGGKQRALSKDEKVFQDRRQPKRMLPYYMSRTKRLHELS